jgi:hypothetical protein
MYPADAPDAPVDGSAVDPHHPTDLAADPEFPALPASFEPRPPAAAAEPGVPAGVAEPGVPAGEVEPGVPAGEVEPPRVPAATVEPRVPAPREAEQVRTVAEPPNPVSASPEASSADSAVLDSPSADSAVLDSPSADSAAPEPVVALVLTEREEKIREFERKWWKHAGSKEQAVRDTFGLSATRYYQLLNGLLDNPAAMEREPALVGRLRRLRSARSRTRRR